MVWHGQKILGRSVNQKEEIIFKNQQCNLNFSNRFNSIKQRFKEECKRKGFNGSKSEGS